MKKTFTVEGTPDDIKTRIKWCRENLGNRGDTWDFAGGMKRVQITVYPGKGLTYYLLKYGNDKPS